MSWMIGVLRCLFVVCIHICSAGYVELPIVLLYQLRCLVYHILSRVIAYICYVYFDAWCITCC